ncbi:MAG: Cob(I)alamin adenosyltransferase [Clostridiales bacterium]|nr:Cob(I)alamin adenosyltransferase [Clostridiales bacterium]
MIQIYTGDGKGKTTAAMGLSLRAVGHGFNVCVIQFLKGSTYSGELYSSQLLRGKMEIYQFGKTCPHAAMIKSGFMKCQKCGSCFIGRKEITGLDRKKIEMAWDFAKKVLKERKYKIVILDEIMSALNRQLIDLDELLQVLDSIPDDIEVVMTGRNAPDKLKDKAHYVTEMKMEKHPFKQGIEARRGIEY